MAVPFLSLVAPVGRLARLSALELVHIEFLVLCVVGKRVSNCKFQEMVSGTVYVKGRSSLARQRREKIARRMRGAGGGGGREGKPPRQVECYAAFLFLPTLALRFVDSGSGLGTKDGSLAILFSSDRSLRIVGTMAHL